MVHLGGLPEAETLCWKEIFLEQGQAASPIALDKILQTLCQVGSDEEWDECNLQGACMLRRSWRREMRARGWTGLY